MKQLVANNMQKLISTSKQNRKGNKMKHIEREHAEWRTIKHIKQKLIHNQSIITKADKSNTLIIIKNDYYINKIENFLINNFTVLSHHITNKQQNIRNCINSSKNIIKPNNKWRYKT
jgi:hypothetical protein